MAWVGRTESKAATFPSGRVRGGGGWGEASVSDDVTRAFLQRVYMFMGVGLAVTGLIALSVASSPAALALVFGNRLVYWGLIIAQLGLVVAFSARATSVSSGTAGLMFFSYAALTGVTLASIFIQFTGGSIASTFFITGGMFAALSFYGVTTKRSLDSVGSFAFMGLIGLIIASVVNIFLKSTMLYWLTTFVGVLVFTGLTAYDTAKLKALAAEVGGGNQVTQWALRGALTLYLDFINLFLLLLRLFGRRRD
jgi:FtsH-binding integral membrane protein